MDEQIPVTETILGIVEMCNFGCISMMPSYFNFFFKAPLRPSWQIHRTYLKGTNWQTLIHVSAHRATTRPHQDRAPQAPRRAPPLQPPTCVCHCQFALCQGYFINGLRLCTHFYLFLSLGILTLRFIHVAMYTNLCSLLLLSYIVWIHHVYPFTCWQTFRLFLRFGCYTHTHTKSCSEYWMYTFFSPRWISIGGMAQHVTDVNFNVLTNFPNAFRNGQNIFHFHSQCLSVPILPRPW